MLFCRLCVVVDDVVLLLLLLLLLVVVVVVVLVLVFCCRSGPLVGPPLHCQPIEYCQALFPEVSEFVSQRSRPHTATRIT